MIRSLIAAFALATPFTVVAQPVPLAEFVKRPVYETMEISPDGKRLAAMAYLEGRRYIAFVNLEDMKVNAIRAPEGNEITSFAWVAPNRVVYTVGEKVAGIEKPFETGELYAVNGDGSSSAMLYGYRKGGMQTGSRVKQATAERGSARLVDSLRDEDNFILVAIDSWDSGTEGAYSKVSRMDVRTGKRGNVIATAPMRDANFLTDHKGNVRFAWGDDTQGKRQVHYRPDDKAKWELVLDERATGQRAAPLGFARDNTVVYWDCGSTESPGGLCTWTDKERDFKRVWSNKHVSMTGLVRSLDGLDVVGVRAMPGRPSLDPLVKGDPTIKIIVSMMQQLPGDDVDLVSSTPDGSKAVFLVAADVNPGAFYLYETATRKGSVLAEVVPSIKPEQLSPVEPFEIKARDGLTLHGYLTRPPGKESAKNLPLVVLVHGGPRARDGWFYDEEVQALASRGYAVLQVNFRGSTGYGYDFVHAGDRQWGRKMQDDVTDATRWAIDTGVADAKRVCIYGGSYGGYAALMGAVREPDLYRCAIGAYGVYDLPMMYTRGDIQKSLWGVEMVKEMLGNDEAELAQYSPANFADRIKAKVMLVVGGQDERVPPAHADKMRAALVKHGNAPEWLYYRSEGHGIHNEDTRLEMLTKVVGFLDANIGAAKN
ncbi:MAG TPA: S9 family peptidase [Dokdonella sp.]|uniref:alpha/beta hydrolase family protein n=1 Tax=Dokdonella sp. TaxID=2291710 RepID=UPI0025BEFD36|nr:S9 family peptidase [Dokdonella sp.]MBX3692058.1 S9 family peptidase [Dokdonella sp.]HNR92505.1 S9 family peptidase [Dokdonella sp.]